MNTFRIFVASMVLSLSSALVMAADAIYKVAEINTDRTQSHSNRNQNFGGLGGTDVHYGTYFLELNGAGYFVARDGLGEDHDRLWRTDGTPAGTTLVRSLPSFSDNGTSTVVTAAVKSGSILYYQVGGSIVRSDGTAAGTYRLAVGVYEMADVNGTLYFSAQDVGEVGYRLYKTNGTKSGTVNVKYFAGTGPRYLTNVSGFLFFNASDGTHGRELWKSDGTELGTTMVRDIVQSGSGNSDPMGITASGGKAYFIPALPGPQLWVSDGTEVGTLMLVNFSNPGNPNANVRHLTDVNGTLYVFVGGSYYYNLQIYKSNGTAATTVVADPGPFGLYLPTSKDQVTIVGDTLYFLAGHRAGSSASFVYRTTGGVAVQVSNETINGPNPSGTGARARAPIVAVGNTVYFGNSPDNTVSIEVCAVDHNVAGSERRVADIFPGINSGVVPYDFAAFNSKLFFTQDNGATGISPYVTDGVTTTLLKDINDTTMGASIGSNIGGGTAVGGGKFFFKASAGNVSKLLFTTGTGVTLIGQEPALSVDKIAGFSGGALFTGQLNKGQGVFELGLFFTDGSTPVFIKARPYTGNMDFLQAVGATMYFTMSTGVPNHHQQLWKTDGTVGGTALVKSFPSSVAQFHQILSSNGVTFLVASDGVKGRIELWRTDGTELGTVLVKDLLAGNSISHLGNYKYLLPFSGGVYFTVRGSSNSNRHYKSDGTELGTVEIMANMNGAFGGGLLGVSNNLLYHSDAYGHLNVYNGTTSTVVLAGSGGDFTDVGGTAFLSAPSGLYKSNGTPAGTELLLSYSGSSASNYTSFAGNLFFLHNPSNAGKELWRSNGTAAGTFMVQDLLPGFKDGAIAIFESVNGALFLSGRNAVDNWELFATLATSTAIARPSVTAQVVTGAVGVPLSFQVQFTGANVTLYSNELPSNYNAFGLGYLPGMTFNPATGIISGTPLEKGFGQFEIVAQNEAGTASAKIDFNIAGPIGTRILDVDGNGSYDALTDGVLMMRYLFGLTGEALIRDAVAKYPDPLPTRTPAEIEQQLERIRPQLDIDQDGRVDALTDGLMLLRYMFGLRGDQVIGGAVAKFAMRTTSQAIEAYIRSLAP